jgi:hypothetical protein
MNLLKLTALSRKPSSAIFTTGIEEANAVLFGQLKAPCVRLFRQRPAKRDVDQIWTEVVVGGPIVARIVYVFDLVRAIYGTNCSRIS